MARLTGLFLRGGNYYLRIVLPENHPLRAQHRCGRWVQTLGACTFREAVAVGTLKRAEVLAGYKPPIRQDIGSVAPSNIAIAAPIHLRTVYDLWVTSKPRTTDSNDSCERAVRLFEKHTENPPLQRLERVQGERFRALLQRLPTTSKTARDRLNWVKVLLKYAAQDLEVIPKSPWVGLDIKSRPTLQRKPWTESELSKLLGHPIWQHGEVPTDPKAGGAAAYWVPLLAMFTGARCSELCQLRVSDVDIEGPNPSISITDQGDGQRVKSHAGLRQVPIHRELIRLGFVEYVKSVQDPLLWPELRQREGKPGGYFSQYFSELRRSLNVPPSIVLHSFRHNVRTALSEARVPETVIDRLLGHEASGSVGARTYTHISLDSLQAAIESLNFPTSSLNRLELLTKVSRR